MSRERSGFELPLVLLGAFRSIIDELHAELAAAGHPDVRPAYGFAMQAIGAEGVTTSELGRRIGVSKQAAAKTVISLETLGYVRREQHGDDARSQLVRRTKRGVEMLDLSAAIFARQRAALRRQLGPGRLNVLEDDLDMIAGRNGGMTRLTDVAGWLG